MLIDFLTEIREQEKKHKHTDDEGGGYEADCIHLPACRRIMKIAKGQGYIFSRHCNMNCTCYYPKDEADA